MGSQTMRTAVPMTGAWIDICALAGFDDVANADVTIQLLGLGPVFVVFGGDSPPAVGSATLVLPRVWSGVFGNADHIWVRGDAGSGSVAVNLEG